MSGNWRLSKEVMISSRHPWTVWIVGRHFWTSGSFPNSGGNRIVVGGGGGDAASDGASNRNPQATMNAGVYVTVAGLILSEKRCRSVVLVLQFFSTLIVRKLGSRRVYFIGKDDNINALVLAFTSFFN